MKTRIAVIGIVVEQSDSVPALNTILHEQAAAIIGRMGIPCRDRGVNVISIAVDAPEDVINSLSGRIGRLPGVSAKTAYSSAVFEED